MNTIEISGRQVFSLKAESSNNAYKGKLAGKFYSRYPYNGKLIIVNESSEFYKDLRAGEVNTFWVSEFTEMVPDANGVEKPIVRYAINGHITHKESLRFKEATIEEAILDAKIAEMTKASLKAEVTISQKEVDDLVEGA